MESQRVPTDPRISRRRASVRRSKRRRMLFASGGVVAALGVVWTMFFSPVLEVQTVKVKGAERSGEATVVEATGLVGDEQNLLLMSTTQIEARVAELPWVADVLVERRLPGTVKIEVTEREPAMVLSLGAARWTIDRHGHVLTSGVAAPGLPTLAGVEVSSIQPGIQLLTEEAEGALFVYRSLPGSLKEEVSAIFAPTSERITLTLSGGTAVRLGAAEEVRAKVKVLASLLKRIASEGGAVAYIDLRVPTSPALSQEVPPGEAGELVSPPATPSPSPSG